MPESEHSEENIAYIRSHVDNLERMVRFQISSDPASREAVAQVLNQRAGAPEFYLALADGPLTQDELASKIGTDRSNVSRIGTYLFDAGLVNKVPGKSGRRQSAYAWSDLEPLLGVSRIAKKCAGASATKAPRTARKKSTPVRTSGSVESDGDSPG